MMTYRKSLLLLALGATTLACDPGSAGEDPDAEGPGGKADDTDDETGPGGLNALDTSFLTLGAGQTPTLRLADISGPHGPLLSPGDQHFGALHDKAEFNASASVDIRGSKEEIFGDLFITGIRYDPCATAAFHGNGTPTERSHCEEELRLVVQPFGGSSFADAAIHLVYAIPPEQGRAVRDGLRAIKAACSEPTDGVPVGPHPCLEGPGREAFASEQIVPFLQEHAGMRRLKGAAVMVTVPGIEWHWRLFIHHPQLGLINEIPHPEAGPLPIIPNGEGADFFGFTDDGSIVPTPTSIATGNGESIGTATLANITPAGAFDGELDGSKQDALVAAYIAENPRLSKLPEAGPFVGALQTTGAVPTRVDGMDCVACHVQSPALTVWEDTETFANLEQEDPKLFERLQAVAYDPLDEVADRHLPASRDLHRRTLLGSNYVVINFGFLFGDPAVNRRTANEARDAARYINEVLAATDKEPEPMPEPELPTSEPPEEPEVPEAPTCDAPTGPTIGCFSDFQDSFGNLWSYQTNAFNADADCVEVTIARTDIETFETTDLTPDGPILLVGGTSEDGTEGWFATDEEGRTKMRIALREVEARDRFEIEVVHNLPTQDGERVERHIEFGNSFCQSTPSEE